MKSDMKWKSTNQCQTRDAVIDEVQHKRGDQLNPLRQFYRTTPPIFTHAWVHNGRMQINLIHLITFEEMNLNSVISIAIIIIDQERRSYESFEPIKTSTTQKIKQHKQRQQHRVPERESVNQESSNQTRRTSRIVNQ
jgi:hypothetical protein